MTNQTDIDALIAAAQEFADSLDVELTEFGNARIHIHRLADALRQERERADMWWKAALTVEGDLFQARARTEAMRIDRDHYRQVSRELAAELARAREVIASLGGHL